MYKNDALRQLWLAAVLLTRLPLPHLPRAAFHQGARAVWAYPLIGAGAGALGAAIGLLALAFQVPAWGAAVLALGAMTLLTGAMHEDGLADVCDGFWGGFTPERRLEIMRDSHIGTYAVLALVLVSAAKISAMAILLEASPLALIAAAAVSRSVMVIVMHSLPHARQDGLSQSVGTPSRGRAAMSFGVGAVVALGTLGVAALVVMFAVLGVAAIIAAIAKRKIGGQTGDVLGAAQQLSEAAALLICTTLL